jgi:linoleoyl-CoA desaturase
MALKGYAFIKFNHTPKDLVVVLVSKVIYFAYMVAIPLLVMDVTWWQWLIGFVTMHVVTGVTLGLVFQMAHVVENTQQPVPDEEGFVETNFAVHQLLTTSNFARKNRFVNWYVGGLNFQVEHHLFPKICSVHYVKLSDITKRVAEKYGIPYLEYPTFGAAIASHYRTLKALGRGNHLVETPSPLKVA